MAMVEIKPGCRVYGRGGRYIGRVEAANSALLRVHGPGPIDEVYYVPSDEVIGSLAGGREIFINCTIDEIDTRGWLKPPHDESDEPSHL